jgi:hypothetical protein
MRPNTNLCAGARFLSSDRGWKKEFGWTVTQAKQEFIGSAMPASLLPLYEANRWGAMDIVGCLDTIGARHISPI